MLFVLFCRHEKVALIMALMGSRSYLKLRSSIISIEIWCLAICKWTSFFFSWKSLVNWNFADADTREEGRSLNDLCIFFLIALAGYKKLRRNIRRSHFSQLVSHGFIISYIPLQMIAILFSILSILWIQKIEASVLVADTTMSRMVELNADAPFCALYHDRGTIQRMVLNADPRKVRQISSNLVADLEETCKASQNKGKVRHLFLKK